jgi:hypothetical protein
MRDAVAGNVETGRCVGFEWQMYTTIQALSAHDNVDGLG